MLGAFPDLAGLQLERIGHSPQPIGRMLQQTRLAGIESSLTARLAGGGQFAMQNFSRPLTWTPKGKTPSEQAALLALADAHERTEARRWPSAFLPALQDVSLVRPG